jgi:predicted phage terminase large subunit-like protein
VIKKIIEKEDHKKCFDEFRKFIREIFYEKDIVFDDQNNFWSIDLMAYYLSGSFVDNNIDKKSNSKFKKMIINLPPRHYKSLVVSVIFPAWILGKNQKTQIIIASHNMRLSSKNVCDVRDLIMSSEVYKSHFPDVKIEKKCNRIGEFKIEGGGRLMAASIRSGAIGFGADFMIVDDPHNPSDVYSEKRLESTTNNFKSNIFSRNNKKNSSMIIAMQRLHVNDLAGMLLKSGNWTQLSIPLIAKSDMNFEYFDEKKFFLRNEILNSDVLDDHAISELLSEVGSQNFNAQYLQAPRAEDGAIVSKEMVGYFESDEDGNIIFDPMREKSGMNDNFSYNFDQNLDKFDKINNQIDLFSEISSISCQKDDILHKNDIIEISKYSLDPLQNALKCDFNDMDFKYNVKNNSSFSYIINNTNAKIIHSWDTANTAQKNNFSVGTVWQVINDKYFLIDLYRKQVDYKNLKKAVIDKYEKYGGTVIIEDKASGSALIQDLQSTTTDMNIVKYKPQKNKKARLMDSLHLFESNKIFFPKDMDWLNDLENELFSFPFSKYDDQVDSITQFLLWIRDEKAKKNTSRLSVGKI